MDCKSETRKPGLHAARVKSVVLLLIGFKACGKCKKVQALRSFHKRAASNDGLAYKCILCVNADSSAWRHKFPGAHVKWYQENKERRADYGKTWRAENQDAQRIRIAEWAKKNASKVNAKCAKRNAFKAAAIPGWANHDAIVAVYAEAERLRRETGARYEVDHIVPLQSKIVCGLHWEGNLQILLKAENISKLNRRWPGMAT